MARIRACDVCYKRKIQCSIPKADDPCNWCQQHKLACTFTREEGRRKTRHRVRLSDVQGLQNRIKELERSLTSQSQGDQQPNRIVQLRSECSTTPAAGYDNSSEQRLPTNHERQSAGTELTECILFSPQAISYSTNFPVGYSWHAGSYLGQNWYDKGIPIFSEKGKAWIALKTGEDDSLGRLKIFGDQSYLFPSLVPLHISYQETWLPSKDIAHKAIDIFSRSPFQLDFPVLDKVLFVETIESAHQTIDDRAFSVPGVLARACVLAALSIISRLEESREALLGLNGDICAAKAQCLLRHVNGDASILSLQAVLMLQKHSTFTGQTQNAMLLHADACRIVCSLGGHIYSHLESYGPDIPHSERQRHHIRRLFWLCYNSDKDISLRSGHPPQLAEDYCDLTLSETSTSYYARLPDFDEGSSIHDFVFEELYAYFPGDTQLNHVKEKACRLLFSAHALKITDGQLLLRIRQLDDDIESWRLSVPPDFRPTLSIPPSHPLLVTDMRRVQSRRVLNIQLEYHYLMTVVHTTVRRCGADNLEDSIMPEDLHNVIHSSVDLALEASRSTLLLLKASISTMPREEFCRTIFYATTAAISIFSNILIHPYSTETQLDVESLASAINIIQSMSVHTLTDGDIKHMQQMTQFVLELIRLSSCAIWKAKREEKHRLI